MNDDKLEDKLKKCFQNKCVMDERLKMQIERRAHEKQERVDNLLLCIIQSAAFILSLFILIVAFTINRGLIMPVILIGYTMTGSIIGIVIALISHRKHHI